MTQLFAWRPEAWPAHRDRVASMQSQFLLHTVYPQGRAAAVQRGPGLRLSGVVRTLEERRDAEPFHLQIEAASGQTEGSRGLRDVAAPPLGGVLDLPGLQFFAGGRERGPRGADPGRRIEPVASQAE